MPASRRHYSPTRRAERAMMRNERLNGFLRSVKHDGGKGGAGRRRILTNPYLFVPLHIEAPAFLSAACVRVSATPVARETRQFYRQRRSVPHFKLSAAKASEHRSLIIHHRCRRQSSKKREKSSASFIFLLEKANERGYLIQYIGSLRWVDSSVGRASPF